MNGRIEETMFDMKNYRVEGMIEITIGFAQFVWIWSSILFEDCWKGEMWNEVWNLLVRNNWWNSRRKKSVIPHDWIGWMVEIGCNQTNNDFDNDRTRFSSSFSKWEKCGYLRKQNNRIFSMLLAFFEWRFREQEHLNMKLIWNGKVLVACKSAVYANDQFP